MKKNINIFFVGIIMIAATSIYAGILINEIHYNPAGSSDETEFIELWNTGSEAIDISGWIISDGIDYTFPAATFIPANEFLVIARYPSLFIQEYANVRYVYGPFASDTKLKNSGEKITLSDTSGGIISEVTYSDSYPWPETPDGGGPSLELKHPGMNLDEAYSWSASLHSGGTPGTTNSAFLNNPLIFSTERSPESPLSFSNVFLTAEFSVGFPTNVTVKYSVNGNWKNKSFAVASDGIWTSSLPAQADGTWVNYLVYAADSNGVVFGNVPELTKTYRVMDTPINKHSVIINEIMYNSSTSANALSYEYVELYNTSSKTIDIAGCIFDNVRLPTNENLLLPGGFAVITDHTNIMNSVYGQVQNLIEADIGISDDGEILKFKSPNEITISKVVFGITNEWPVTPNGRGPSLELKNPYSDPSIAENWSASSNFGSPGLQNSNYSTGTFASLMNIKLVPSSPNVGEEVSVTAETLASTNIISLILEYRTNDIDLLSVEMYDDGAHNDSLPGDGIYGTAIPPINYLTYVWYRFKLTLADSSSFYFGEEKVLPDSLLIFRLSGGGLHTEVIPADQWQLAVTTGMATSSRLYIYLDSKNKILVDDVSIKNLSGSEYIVNGNFDSDDSGWLKTGNHSESVFNPFSGYSSPGCEKVIAMDTGGSSDNSLNRYTSPSLNTYGPEYVLSFAYKKLTTEWFNYYNGKRDFSFIFVNEIMARNNSTVADDNGNFSDWIELYNAGTNSVPIGGLYLTDNLAKKDKWQIPTGTTIEPKGYIIFWADGGDDNDKHTNFKLNSDGESVGLFSPEKILIDSIDFGAQFADVSFGRLTDGSNQWASFSRPTPNAANATDSAAVSSTRTSAPDFSIPGGFYTGNQSLSLSVESPLANIHYTIDGSFPTTNFLEYNTPINITTTTVVRAYALENNYLPSEVVTHTYFINEGSDLPIVSLSTTPALLWDDTTGIYKNDITDVEIPVSMEFYEPDGTMGFTLDAGTQIGGWNIFRFAQNPLNIYARNRYGYSFINYKIFKTKYVSQFKKIALRNGGDDWPGTMFRDPMMQSFAINRMSNAIMAYRPCVVFLNGDYWGIHNIREKYDEQYFIANFGLKAGEFEHIKYDLSTDKPTAAQGDLIHYNNMMDFIENNDMSDSNNYEYVKSLMDVDSFIDRTIMGIFTADTSWHHNDEWWRQKNDTDKWKWVIVDLDRGFNIANVSRNMLSDVINNDEIFKHLIQNSEFKNNFITRTSTHLNTTFEKNRIIRIVDDFKNGIISEMPRHITRWSSEGGISSMNSWENEIEELKDFEAARGNYVAQHIKSQFGLGNTNTLFLSVSKPGGGKIFVNNISIPNDSFSGNFFINIPMNLNFVPAVGYDFSRWEECPIDNTVTLLPKGSIWSYLDNGSNQSNNWIDVDFDDSGWATGAAQFGYGDGDEATVINYGPDSNNKYITTYFRTSFVIADSDEYAGLFLKLLRDDGAIIYINGKKVVSANMPETANYQTLANYYVADADEDTFFTSFIDNEVLVPGTNIIAAEIHQFTPQSSDMSFDLELKGLQCSGGAANIISYKNNFTYNFTNSVIVSAIVNRNDDLILPINITNDVTLSKTEKPYFAQGDIIVHSNATLKINAGVNIQMPDSAGIYVYGKLEIIGEKNNPVVISPAIKYNANKWGAVCFINAAGTSVLSHVRFESATHGIDPVNQIAAVSAYDSCIELNDVHISADFPVIAQSGNTIIRNSIFRSDVTCDLIHIINGKALIENCDLGVNYALDTDAIDFDGVYDGIIASNQIHDLLGVNSDGIDIGESSSNVIIRGNVIFNCADKGISVGQNSSVSLKYNVIRNCTHGIGIKDKGSFAYLDRNTFFENTVSIACYEKHKGSGGGTAKIINTIMSFSSALSFMTDSVSSIKLSYSLSDKDYLPGISNLFDDPMFIDPGNFNFVLEPDSPCVNAGDPLSPPDPDGSRADIGAYNYVPEPVSIYYLSFIIYYLLRKKSQKVM